MFLKGSIGLFLVYYFLQKNIDLIISIMMYAKEQDNFKYDCLS